MANEGYGGFYKGMLMPLLGVGVQVSVQFGIVETLKKILKQKYADINGLLDPKYSFFCGGIAGIFSGIILVLILINQFIDTFRSRKIQSIISKR